MSGPRKGGPSPLSSPIATGVNKVQKRFAAANQAGEAKERPKSRHLVRRRQTRIGIRDIREKASDRVEKR